jgi:hypothetical protein
VTELALRPNASVAPHSNANLTYLVVIEGGGYVQVGEEQARVAAGEAVVWPPDVLHAVWTELTPLRAIVVEFAVGPDDATIAIVAGEAGAIGEAGADGVPDAPAPQAFAPVPDAQSAPEPRPSPGPVTKAEGGLGPKLSLGSE